MAIQSRRIDVKKCLEGSPHLFTYVTGEAAKALGAKSAKSVLWGLTEWADEYPAVWSHAASPVEEQASLGDDGIPF
jgi:hypothetical protein